MITGTAGGTGLDARIVVRRSSFKLDIELHIRPGEVVALLGPNGAGKTTALRALAGLHELTAGYIDLDGLRWDGGGRDFLAPEHRRVGVVFQDYLLFPHLSALENVAFGPRSRGMDRTRARQLAQEWLDRVGVGELAGRRPAQLSGGQAQRVALARALAAQPALLLLDEPLAALDARTRLDTRAELHRQLRSHPGPALVVTHDPLDALMLADRIVIVESGRIVQEGDPASVTARPRTDYVARLVGLNLHRGQADDRSVTLDNGAVLSTVDSNVGEVFVAFAPAAVALHRMQPEGSPQNTWRATVVGVESYGDNVRVRLAGGLGDTFADVTPAAAAALRLGPGEEIWAAVKASQTRAYPA